MRPDSKAQFAILVLTMVASSSFGRHEQLSFSQSRGESVVVTLSGELHYCDGTLGGFVGSPQLAISGNQVDVVSTIFAGECPPPLPGSVFPPPHPYTISVDLGPLPDGVFHVSWSFVGIGAVTQTFSSTITLSGGHLPAPVPIFSPPLTVAFAFLLSAIGIATLRR